jgi:hypothetical protein
LCHTNEYINNPSCLNQNSQNYQNFQNNDQPSAVRQRVSSVWASVHSANSENSGRILQELQGKYAADVAIVGIGQWVGEVESRNNAFGELVKNRFDETALSKRSMRWWLSMRQVCIIAKDIQPTIRKTMSEPKFAEFKNFQNNSGNPENSGQISISSIKG